MENRFAGAADLGDRRRRRLSQDDVPDYSNSDARPAERPIKWNDLSTVASRVDVRLLRRAISPRLWKHLVVLCFGLLGIIGLFYARQAVAASGETFANGFHAPVPFEKTLNVITGTLLLLAAQLALLVGWVRSGSDIDYKGRYRWWKWLAAGQAVLAVLLLTNMTAAVPELITALLQPFTGQISAARYAVVVVPAMTFWGIVLSKVVPDMSRSFLSQSLLLVAVLTVVVRFMLIHGAATATINPMTLNAMVLSAAFAAFASMLLHCRYVAFICNDPPVQQHQPKSETSASDEWPAQTTGDVDLPAATIVSKTIVAEAITAEVDDVPDKASTESKADSSEQEDTQPATTRKTANRAAGNKRKSKRHRKAA